MNGRAPGWEQTRELVLRGIDAGWHRGFQATVRHGDEAWDLSLGTTSGGDAMTPSTCCPWLSAGKPLTALVVARAVQADVLDWDDPVVRWVPEFGGGGKHEVTIRHVLNHTGGFRSGDNLEPGWDWWMALAHVCAAPLESGWVPGTTAGYHARGSWLVLGEVLRRAWGKDFESLVVREVTRPLGCEGLRFSWTREAALACGMGWSGLVASGPMGAGPGGHGEAAKEPARVDPGSGLRGTAREMARWYAALVTPPPGWLDGSLVAELVRPQRAGVVDRTFGAVMSMGLGFILNTGASGGLPTPYGYGPHASARAFGHSGSQSTCAFADPAHGLAVAWCFCGMPGEPIHQRRQREVNAAIYQDLGLALGC